MKQRLIKPLPEFVNLADIAVHVAVVGHHALAGNNGQKFVKRTLIVRFLHIRFGHIVQRCQ